MTLPLSGLAFPPSREPSTRAPADLRKQGFGVRIAEQRDLGFMRALYETLRAEEMARVAWPEGARQSFLDSQFTLQHRHFTTQFQHAEFLVLEHRGQAVGRLYLLRESPRWLVIDIGLLPAWQGRGIGGALLRQLQRDAQGSHAQGLALHVRLDNGRAHALYVRLGFREQGGVEGLHQRMHWDVPTAVAQLNTA